MKSMTSCDCICTVDFVVGALLAVLSIEFNRPDLLWSPYGGQTIIFSSCRLFLILLCFASSNLSCRRLDVCHTSTHGVALVRI